MEYNSKNKNIQQTKKTPNINKNKKQQQHVNQYSQLAKFKESLIDTKKKPNNTKHFLCDNKDPNI